MKDAVTNLGEYYVGVVNLMPGLTSVDLEEQGSDFVIIRTNEGLMKRTYISVQIEGDSVVIEFDEEYQAGRMITTKSHYVDDFTTSATGVKHSTKISDVVALGLLCFFYRTLAKNSTGKAVLNSHKTYFEKQCSESKDENNGWHTFDG